MAYGHVELKYLNDSGGANINAFFGNISGGSVVLYVWLYKLRSKI